MRTTIRTMKLRPHPHQHVLDAKISTSWLSYHNVLAVSPCGSGKTIVFAEVLRKHQGASVAIAHRQELVGQMSLALARDEVPHRIIGPSDLVREIVQIHTEELGRTYYAPNAPCAVAGVDTLISWSKPDSKNYSMLMRWANQVTLWVIDEAHHLLKENKWGKAVALFPNARGLGVTATPERADGKGLGSHADGLFDDMVLGPTMRDLIDGLPDWEGNIRPYLTDYRIFCPPPTNFDLASVGVGADGDYVRKKLGMVTRNSSIIGDVVTHYLKWAAGKLGVTFAPDIETATDIARRFNEAGVPAEIITAKTPGKVRRAIIRQFRQRKLMQLVNVDLFGEGFDLPAIECVSMARATESYSLYAQQFSRSVRLMEGKKVACIASGELVLTDRGLVPIELVQLTDKLWDGTEWITHEGVVYKGEKEVISYAGLTATPDHRVKTKEGWQTLGECAAQQNGIVKTGAGRDAIRECQNYFVGNTPSDARRYIPSTGSLPVRNVSKGILDLVHEFTRRPNKRVPHVQSARTCSDVALSSVTRCGATVYKSKKSNVGHLRGSRYTVPVQLHHRGRFMGPGEPRVTERDATGPHRQQRALRSWKFKVVHSASKHVAHHEIKMVRPVSHVSGHLSRREVRRFHTTGVSTKILRRGDRDPLLHDALLQTRRSVWDILNAGPRNCFTVSDLLVHNCVIDHVGNVIRHGGPPDRPRVWTLDRRERRSSSKDDDTIPMRTCLNPECMAPYERVYPACPLCGWIPTPAGRTAPEMVEGDLYELTPEVLDAMFGAVQRVDRSAEDVFNEFHPLHGYPIAKHQANKHAEKQQAQAALRDMIAWWGGARRHVGIPDSVSYREFYFKFGVDVVSAQALGRADAEALTGRIAMDLAGGMR